MKIPSAIKKMTFKGKDRIKSLSGTRSDKKENKFACSSAQKFEKSISRIKGSSNSNSLLHSKIGQLTNHTSNTMLKKKVKNHVRKSEKLVSKDRGKKPKKINYYSFLTIDNSKARKKSNEISLKRSSLGQGH